MFSLDSPIAWTAPHPEEERSFLVKLHGWAFMEPALTRLVRSSVSRDERLFALCLDWALDWIDFANSSAHDDEVLRSIVWSDIAVAHRAKRLAFLINRAAADPSVDGTVHERLVAEGYRHLRAAATEVAASNNHGILQCVAALILSSDVPELRRYEGYRNSVLRRLEEIVRSTFTSSHIFLEHSPKYHFLVTRWLGCLHEIDAGQSQFILDVRRGAEMALAWMIRPDGMLAHLGDTDDLAITAGRREMSGMLSQDLKQALSGSAIDSFGGGGLMACREAGQVFIRGGAPSGPNSSYVAAQAAFHSLTHKHADDGSFEWFDAGRPIIVNPGIFGFDRKALPWTTLRRAGFRYATPERIYVESTHAHNTVEIDGTSDVRKAALAYGSALWSVDECTAGRYRIEFRIPRSSGVHHRRILHIALGRWLLVVDDLHCLSGRIRRYEQWFHVAPGFARIADRHVAAAFRDGAMQLEIAAATEADITVLHGARRPRLQGWHSRRAGMFEPNHAVGLATSGKRVRLCTLLDLTGRGIAGCRIGEDAGQPQVGWTYRDGDGESVAI